MDTAANDTTAPVVADKREEHRFEIGMATDTGFVVRQGAILVGAFTTCSEMCRWIEDEWRKYDPPHTSVNVDLPNVARLPEPRVMPMPDAQRRTGWVR